MTEAFERDMSLYNSLILRGFVELAVRRCPQVNIDEAIAYAGIEAHQLEDEDHWFTQSQVDRFYEKLLELTGDPDIAREMGRYAASSSLGIVRHYALSFWSPAQVCEAVRNAIGFLTRSVVWETKRIGGRLVEMTVTPKPGVQEKPFHCQSRLGYLEGVCGLFKHAPVTVEHVECVVRGGQCCRYLIKWPKSDDKAHAKTRNYIAFFLSLLSAGLYFVFTPAVSLVSFMITSALFLALSEKSWRREKKDLLAAIGNLRSASELSLQRIMAHQNRVRLMQEIGRALDSQATIEGIVRETSRALETGFRYDRGLMLLADKEKRRLTVRATFGYPEGTAPHLHDEILSDWPESESLIARCFREKKPFLGAAMDDGGNSAPGAKFIKAEGAKPFICCPIACPDEALGVLVVESIETRSPPLQRDMDLLMQVSREIGVSIRSITVREAEEAVRESEARFRAVVEKSSEVVVLMDAGGSFLYVSPPVTAVFGYQPEECVGQHWEQLAHPEDHDRIVEFSPWLFAHPGETIDVVVRVRHKDGAWRWAEITARNLLSEPGVWAVVSNVRDVTERKIAEETLRESENKFKHLVEESLVGVFLVQGDRFKYVNARFAEIHGYKPSEMIDRVTTGDTRVPGDPPLPSPAEDFQPGRARARQFRIMTRSGEIRTVETYSALTTYGGRPALIGTILDVTDRKADEEALQWKTTFLEALVKSTHDGILVVNSQGRMVMQNQRTKDIWKIPEDLDIGKLRMEHFTGVADTPERLREKILYLNEHPDETMRDEFVLKMGTIVETSSSPVIGEDGKRYGRIWTFRDVTELKHYWDMLVELSTTDGLTELANRRRFDEFLDREWRRSMRDQSPLSLILMDIDFFKEYNDHYGHLAGDDCLKHVAGILGRMVQRPGDLVARYGGEEFACILPDVDQRGASALADKIMKSINKLNLPHAGSAAASHVTLSFGVASMVPEKGQSAEELIRLADHLLYTSKNGGRNRVSAWGQKEKRRSSHPR